MPDLRKLVLHSDYPAFKNNAEHEGSFSISGTYQNGTINTRTHTATLNSPPDLVDVVVNGRVIEFDGSGNKLVYTDRWGHPPLIGQFLITTQVDMSPDGRSNEEPFWFITIKISGSQVVFTARSPSPYNDTVNDGDITPTPISYKIVDYSVAGGESSGSKLSFDSRLNYLKKDTSRSGNTTLVLPDEFDPPVEHTVNHNLGYIPFFHVGSEIHNGSTVWSNNRVHQLTASSNTGAHRPAQLFYYLTTSDLVISLSSGEGSKHSSGSRDVYWNIYLDYGS